MDSKQGETYTYTYDNLHRMTTETSSGGLGNMALTYDAMGNILTKSVGADTLTYGYLMNGATRTQRLSSVACGINPPKSFVHDANGNMTLGWDFSDPANPVQRTIQYNGDDMPITATLGLNTSVFAYDGSGSRAVMEVVGGDVTHYVAGGYEVTGGVPVKYISGGGMTIVKMDSTGKTFMHQDHLGSASASTDASGAALGGADYRPFGLENNAWGTFTDKYRYTGQEKDFSTGLYNYGARLYDPVLGRFISADSLIPDLYNPQSLNRYAYCLNNPLTYIDPTGHWEDAPEGVKVDGTVDLTNPLLPPAMNTFYYYDMHLLNDMRYHFGNGNYGNVFISGVAWGLNYFQGMACFATDVIITSPYNSGVDLWIGAQEGDLVRSARGGASIAALVVFNQGLKPGAGAGNNTSNSVAASVADDVPGAASKRLLPGLKINSKQFGKKIGKHTQDFGLDPSDPAARKFMQDKIESIVGRYDQVKQGVWRGGVQDAIYYRQGADVVVTKVDGSFITILKDGVNNSFFKGAGGL